MKKIKRARDGEEERASFFNFVSIADDEIVFTFRCRLG